MSDPIGPEGSRQSAAAAADVPVSDAGQGLDRREGSAEGEREPESTEAERESAKAESQTAETTAAPGQPTAGPSKPEQTKDDTDIGWGRDPDPLDAHDRWLLEQRPPHWD